MRVALIACEPADARRALPVARGLRIAGNDITLVVPQTSPQPQRPGFADTWEAEGFAWIPTGSGLRAGQPFFPRDLWQGTATCLASLVEPFDVCWFFAAEWALQTARERRFRIRASPLIVLDVVDGNEPLPKELEQINRQFARGYAEQWADVVYRNVTGDEDRRAREIENRWQMLADAPVRAIRAATTTPAVTICVPYFEEPKYLPEVLASLDAQTSDDFTVVMVDDGSASDEARRVFAASRERYAARGWTFLEQPNAGPGAARNHAAAYASTEFLLFLDADDIAMPEMIERFLHAALLSEDDCLVARNYAFDEDPNGPCAMLYDPPGNSLVGSMGDDMHGGSCIFIRRDAFMKLGGFTVVRGVGFEDYELHVRANLARMRWDVLPWFVYRYRMPRHGGVSKSTALYPNLARVSRWYRERLEPIGLGQLPLAFASAYWANDGKLEKVHELERKLAPRKARPSPQGRELKLLMLTCNFPFELASGWHNRVQQMIRYFGSRYQLTLMTSMPRELIARHRKETFADVHAVLGVEGSPRSAITDLAVPFRVREHYTDVYQRAIQSVPTDQYHAAILDQLFMAEFRKDIETKCVLTEHNVESRLLRQASERVWANELPLHYQNAIHEAELVERYEDEAWRAFPLRAAVSEPDRAEMDRRAPAGKTVVAPNGADPATWIAEARFDRATVLFTGHLAYLPNVDAVEYLLADIWPRVGARMPEAKLILAGRAPSPVVQVAVDRARGMGVTLIASPESMDTVARAASVTIAPLRLGSGTRIKILESMAWGLPVVSTTIGAEGIDASDGEHLLLADDADAFADAIVRVLSDESLWRTLRTNGAELIRERYSWDHAFAALNEALLELIG